MKYAIPGGKTGLQLCIHDAEDVGVGRTEEEREKFQNLLQRRDVDYYICPHCIYCYSLEDNDMLFKDLDVIERFGKNYLIQLENDKKLEIVDNARMSICCELKECTHPEIMVKEYNPQHLRKKKEG